MKLIKTKCFNLIDFFLLYCTALHYAVKENNIKMVKLLLSMPNIDINIQSIFIYIYL